jgi:hypothetical protein
LDKKAPVTWNIRPACLPDKTFIHYAERPSTYRFTVTGWGDLNFKDSKK